MRERTWLTTADPEPMLRFLKDRATTRKARLLVCAAARRNWENLPDPRSRRAFEVAELLADGMADADAIFTAERDAYAAVMDVLNRGDYMAPLDSLDANFCLHDTVELMWSLVRDRPTLRTRLHNVTHRAMMWWLGVGKVSVRRPSPEVWCDLIRDIFGNPFRPVAFNPRWRTADTVGIATGIYEDGAFDRLPLLADALMDAGCADEQVLGHCRSEGPHTRGCFVLDMVLKD